VTPVAQAQGLSWPQACDACLATSIRTAGTNLDVSLPVLAGMEDSSPAAAVAALAVVLGGYWSGPIEEPEFRMRRRFAENGNNLP
jgi:hypothetical protein